MIEAVTPHLVHVRMALEIGVFWFIYYFFLIYIKDSGMFQALKGLVVLAFFFFVAQFLELRTVQWVLQNFFSISIIAMVIIFQPELRRGLTRIGQSPLFKFFLKEERLIDEVVKAASLLSKNRIGALMAFEREVSLKNYIESGILLDAMLTAELLNTLFVPGTPLHDGGVVIQGSRVVAASCLFPLSQTGTISKSYGTRHRAALGLSEETDAFIIVVSEETGRISLMEEGKIKGPLEAADLKAKLYQFYQIRKTTPKKPRFSFRRARK